MTRWGETRDEGTSRSIQRETCLFVPYVSLSSTSSIFSLISIWSLMCTSDDRKSQGDKIARARDDTCLGEKNCARKSSVVEAYYAHKFDRKTYLLLSFYWEWRTRYPQICAQSKGVSILCPIFEIMVKFIVITSLRVEVSLVTSISFIFVLDLIRKQHVYVNI